MILMHLMLAGLMVLDESSLYTWGELFLLYGSAVLVVIGIYILTKKQNLVVIKDQEDLLAKGEQQTFFVGSDIDLNHSQVRLGRSSMTRISVSSREDLKEELLPAMTEEQEMDNLA